MVLVLLVTLAVVGYLYLEGAEVFRAPLKQYHGPTGNVKSQEV